MKKQLNKLGTITGLGRFCTIASPGRGSYKINDLEKGSYTITNIEPGMITDPGQFCTITSIKELIDRRKTMKIKITFTEPLLGTIAGDKQIFEDFIASNNPQGISQEEIDALPDVNEIIEKTSTFFARDKDKTPMLWDYQIKGFFKEAAEAMISTDTITKTELKDVRLTNYLYKRTIDKQIFITPRRIRLNLNDGELSFCQRPLRGQTQRGERIALARSEQAPIGTSIEIEIIVLNKKLNDYVKRWLDYGALYGFGQWRNSGMGRFKWQLIED